MSIFQDCIMSLSLRKRLQKNSPCSVIGTIQNCIIWKHDMCHLAKFQNHKSKSETRWGVKGKPQKFTLNARLTSWTDIRFYPEKHEIFGFFFEKMDLPLRKNIFFDESVLEWWNWFNFQMKKKTWGYAHSKIH